MPTPGGGKPDTKTTNDHNSRDRSDHPVAPLALPPSEIYRETDETVHIGCGALTVPQGSS